MLSNLSYVPIRHIDYESKGETPESFHLSLSLLTFFVKVLLPARWTHIYPY